MSFFEQYATENINVKILELYDFPLLQEIVKKYNGNDILEYYKIEPIKKIGLGELEFDQHHGSLFVCTVEGEHTLCSDIINSIPFITDFFQKCEYEVRDQRAYNHLGLYVTKKEYYDYCRSHGSFSIGKSRTTYNITVNTAALLKSWFEHPDSSTKIKEDSCDLIKLDKETDTRLLSKLKTEEIEYGYVFEHILLRQKKILTKAHFDKEGQILYIAQGTESIDSEIINTGDYDITEVRKVVLPDSIKIIGKDSFNGFKNLCEINLPYGLLKIESGAFTHTALKKVEIPDSVEYLGEKVFSNSSIEEIRLSEKIHRIQESAFSSTKLKTIHLSDGCTSIANYAFENSSLEKIELPQSLRYIGKEAFMNTELSEIRIPPLVKTIEESAFRNCKLKKVEFSDGLIEICNLAFSGNPNIIKIAIPSTVKFIGFNSFKVDLTKTKLKLHSDFNSNEFYYSPQYPYRRKRVELSRYAFGDEISPENYR